jgi:ubiquinone/menaquinone biosynthesis C-methylase UbiE
MMDSGSIFDTIDVDDYERYRPDYAREAVDWFRDRIRLKPAGTVLDLGAGTGKLTRTLVDAGLDVIALEPSVTMRRKLTHLLGPQRALAGRAEEIPLPDASVSAVTVAQAFHHFRLPDATDEIARVLEPGGALALFWNEYSVTDPVKLAVDEIMDRYIPPHSVSAITGRWRDQMEGDANTLFARGPKERFPHPHTFSRDALRDLLATDSAVASLPSDARARLLSDIDALARTLPDPITVDANTRVDLFTKC